MSVAWPGDEAVREAAREVLSREEYRRFRWVESDWLDTLRRWVDDYLGWMRHLEAVSPALFWLLIGGMLLLAVLMLVHVVWSLRVALRSGVEEERAAPPPRRDFLAEAGRLAERGEILEACRALQLGCLERLMREGTLELARHEANDTLRERLRRARLPDALREELIGAIDGLERSWFRDRVPDRELYRRWLRVNERLGEATA